MGHWLLLLFGTAWSPTCNVKSDIGSNSQKTVTPSTIKVLHHSTSQECVTAFI